MGAQSTDHPPISNSQVATALSPYKLKTLSEGQLTSIGTYVNLLKKWNQTIPLTSLEEDSEVVSRHFGESIFASQLIPMETGRLADVGSGAGFPGLALKIALPALRVTLLESNVKKCAFLREVKEKLALTNTDIVRCPYEEFTMPERLDFICARALGNYRHMLHWARSVIKPTGRVILWLGVDDSIAIGRVKDWRWELPVNIPESRRRIILIGRCPS